MDTSFLYDIILISISIILSFFFSSAETSLISLTELRVKLLINDMGEKAKDLELLLKHPNKILNTILFCNNLVNIFASVVAANIMLKLFQSIPVAATTGIMTLLILVFGEIIPKAFAKNNSIKVAIFTMGILKYFYYILMPVTWVMNKFVSFLLSLTDCKSINKYSKITEGELEYLINEGEKDGILDNNKREMLSNIFYISDTDVKEVMVPRIDIVSLPEDANKESIERVIEETEFSRIPIYKDFLDNIIGVLYAKDLIRFKNKDYTIDDLKPYLRKPLFVPESKKVDVMLKEFQKSRLHMAVVLDEYGGTAGIVTMEDILEEIVGDILDEFDEVDTEVVKVSDNIYSVDARMDIDDFCDYFNLAKVDDMSDFETLGGLVLDLAGEIPSESDSFEWQGYRIIVKSICDKRLERIDVEKLLENTKDG